MADLADLVGQLSASLIRGRLQADIEAVRVAELYSSHPYLRHFPIPKFRLPNVELDIPLAVETVPAGADGIRSAVLPASEIKEEVDRALSTQLDRHGMELPREKLLELRAELAKVVDHLQRADEVAVDVLEVSKQVRKRIADKIRSDPGLERLSKTDFAANVGRGLNVQLLNRRPVPEGIRVIAETALLKEVMRDAEVVRLRMTMAEDAVEWTVVEVEGEDESRLVPE